MPATPTAGEQTLARFRAHWHTLLILVPALAGAAALQLALLHTTQLPDGVPLLVAGGVWGVAGGFALVTVLRWATTSYLLTDRRIVRSYGILRRQSLEIPLTEIASIKVSQTIIERLLRYGDITVETAGDSDQKLDDIPRPKQFKVQLSNARDRAGGGRRTSTTDDGTCSHQDHPAPSACRLDPAAPAPDGPPPPPRTRADNWDTIARLGPLVESGVLTPDQFDQAMRDLAG